jgi:hypothetical protein
MTERRDLNQQCPSEQCKAGLESAKPQAPLVFNIGRRCKRGTTTGCPYPQPKEWNRTDRRYPRWAEERAALQFEADE